MSSRAPKFEARFGKLFGHRFVGSPSGRERNVRQVPARPPYRQTGSRSAPRIHRGRAGARIRRRHPIDERLDIASAQVPFLDTRKRKCAPISYHSAKRVWREALVGGITVDLIFRQAGFVVVGVDVFTRHQTIASSMPSRSGNSVWTRARRPLVVRSAGIGTAVPHGIVATASPGGRRTNRLRWPFGRDFFPLLRAKHQ